MSGQNPYEPLITSSSAEPSTSGKATTALVLGLFSLIAWCLPVSITGLVFAVKAQNSNRSGMAIAGLVLNIIGLCLTVFNGALGAYLRLREL